MATRAQPQVCPATLSLDRGRARFGLMFRRHRKTFTQTDLIKLCEAVHGARIFHSSQSGGLETDSLWDPAPRMFIALGYMNLALARSVGFPEELIEPAPDIGASPRLPATLRPLWEGKEPLLDANGIAMGPTGLFEVFCGLREPSDGVQRLLPPEQDEAASRAAGRWLRLRLGAKGIDWVEEMPQLTQTCPFAEDLLQGKTISGHVLMRGLSLVAQLGDATREELWAAIAQELGT